jgi:hypothetical protein
MARRWRSCNLASPEPFETSDDEDLWRDEILGLLSKAHTIGGIAEFTLETVESNYSVRAPLSLTIREETPSSFLLPTGTGSCLGIGV